MRLRACPVALARRVWASQLPAIYASTQGGLPIGALGVGVLSEGAAEMVSTIGAAWTWRRAVESDARDAETRAARSAAKRGQR